jgi:hypothetical protein
MKLAIMQPYLFPYIGYFQLLNAVDTFVVYDDVNFIKQGWINRNSILVNGQPHLFTLPVQDASSFNKISQTQINRKIYRHWHPKFLRTIEQSYAKAPFFKNVFPIIKEILQDEDDEISPMIQKSLLLISAYLGIQTRIVPSSGIYDNRHLTGQERVIDICIKEKASDYINLIGGRELYSAAAFKERDVRLHFIKTKPIHYPQGRQEFIPWLSILDVMMFNPPEQIWLMLTEYELI